MDTRSEAQAWHDLAVAVGANTVPELRHAVGHQQRAALSRLAALLASPRGVELIAQLAEGASPPQQLTGPAAGQLGDGYSELTDAQRADVERTVALEDLLPYPAADQRDDAVAVAAVE